MKKFYTIFTLLLLGMVGFTSQAVTVTLQCMSYWDKLEVRDGGAEGQLIELTGEQNTITVENSLYILLNDDELILSTVNYSWYTAQIENNSCNIPVENLTDDMYVTVTVQAPKYVTFNVSDPSLVTIKKGQYANEEFELTTGANRLKLGQYDGIYIEVKDRENMRLTRVYRVSDNKSYEVKNFRECAMYSYDMNDGDLFGYVVVPASEFSAPSFRLRVDNPAEARISVDYNSVDDLVANEWKDMEMSGAQANVSISHINYGTDIFSVKKNGVEQSGSYGSYYFSALEGDEIDVKVDFPDEDYKVTVATEPAENSGFITAVSLNGENIDNWQDEMTVHCGNKLKFTMNKDMYVLNGIKVNGVDQDLTYVYETWEYKAVENADIVFLAEKNPTFQLPFTVNDASAVVVKLNYKEVPIQNGENIIEYTSDANYFQLEPTFGSTIDKIEIMLDGEVLTAEGKYTAYLDQSIEWFNVTATPLTRDKQFVLYLSYDNGPDLYYFNIFRQNDPSRVDYPNALGYSVVDFGASENPFAVTWYPRNFSLGYLNGEPAPAGQYGGFELNFEDGDVFKLFDDKEPQTYTAGITVDGDRNFTVKKDIIVAVDDLTQPISDFEGTAITIIPDPEHTLEVYVKKADAPAAEADGDEEDKGTKVELGEDGVYTVILDSDMTITAGDEAKNGVESVAVATTPAAGNSDVYTVTGMLVLRNATPAQLKALPAGIYIVGGAKYVRK